MSQTITVGGKFVVPLDEFPQGVSLRECLTVGDQTCFCIGWSEAMFKKTPENERSYDLLRCRHASRCGMCKRHYPLFEMLTTSEERAEFYHRFHSAHSFEQLCADSRAVGFGMFGKYLESIIRDGSTRDAQNAGLVQGAAIGVANAHKERADKGKLLAQQFTNAMRIEAENLQNSPQPLGYSPNQGSTSRMRSKYMIEHKGFSSPNTSRASPTQSTFVDHTACDRQYASLKAKCDELEAYNKRLTLSETSLRDELMSLNKRTGCLESDKNTANIMAEQANAELELADDRIEELVSENAQLKHMLEAYNQFSKGEILKYC